MPSPWLAIRRFVSRVTSREFWARTREDETGTGRDYTRFATLLGLFSLMMLATLGVGLIAVLLSGDGSPSLGSPVHSPSPTAQTRAPTTAEGLTDTPWIDAQTFQDDPLQAASILVETAVITGDIQLAEAGYQIRFAIASGRPLDEDYLCPILDSYNANYSSGPAGAPACGDALVAPPPEGDISLGIWANELNAWWFGELPEGSAAYSEGNEAPFLLTWASEAGGEYTVVISYACRVDGVPAIDILSGVQSAGAEIFEAEWGPGTNVPEAAVPLPDTPDLDVDDGSVRLLYLYGGDFLLLPRGSVPAEGCEDERTITVPVRADADAEGMILMGSLRLADSSAHDGQGAADAAADITLRASVSGVGQASSGLEPGVIAP